MRLFTIAALYNDMQAWLAYLKESEAFQNRQIDDLEKAHTDLQQRCDELKGEAQGLEEERDEAIARYQECKDRIANALA